MTDPSQKPENTEIQSTQNSVEVPVEREAIVAWLKAQAARCLKNKRELREMLSPAEWDKLTASEMAYRFAAKALKRGDHIGEQHD